MTKHEKIKIIRHACTSAATSQPIQLVSARSPELLHAQIGLGDPSLPRSVTALTKIKSLAENSSRFLPTKVNIFLADLAIDNFEKISHVCDIARTLDQNQATLTKIAHQIGLPAHISRLSSLTCKFGPLKDVIHSSGQPLINIILPHSAWPTIRVVMKESIESHQRMFNWTQDQSEKHNQNIAVTMGCVGNAINNLFPLAILIHNESFISRGHLNNIFNPLPDPLPVICLKDLLENKKTKI